MAKSDRENKGNLGGILHIVGNVVGIALIAVLLPVMCINMTLIVKSYTQPDKVPTVFGVAPLIVMSGSMHDTIQINDLILTKATPADKLKADDVIAFQPVGATTVVTHRIIGINEDGSFVTKGDWNNAEDKDPVFESQIVGKYFQRFPGVGEIALFLQQPIGMVVFVAVPLALFLAYDLLRRFFYNKKHKNDGDAEKEELERLRALAAQLEAGVVPEMPIAEAAPAAEPVAEPAYPPVEGEEALPEIGEAAAEDDIDGEDEV